MVSDEMTAALLEEGWPEHMHENVEQAQASMRLALLGLVALTAGLGQADPVTAALDIMRTQPDVLISPASLRAIVEEFDAR